MNDEHARLRGRFITCEGIDGAGKSSHIAAIAAFLRQRGLTVVSTREPGTPLGEKLRALLLHETMHLETEALLMFAARREHIACVIEPALARGDWVCLRPLQRCHLRLSEWRPWPRPGKVRAARGAGLLLLLQPDLSLLFDLPAAVAAGRIAGQARDRDRFEQERLDFHERLIRPPSLPAGRGRRRSE